MGQYHYTVNLDRHEFLNPHKLGMGLKQLEQFGFDADMGCCLGMLLSVSTGRGGGDFTHPQETKWDYSNGHRPGSPQWEAHFDALHQLYTSHEVFGRWAGDRIAIVGDYAEDDDLPAEHHAGSIYFACYFWEQAATNGMQTEEQYLAENTSESDPPERITEYRERYAAISATPWVEISDLLLPYLPVNWGVRVDIDSHGWRSRVKA